MCACEWFRGLGLIVTIWWHNHKYFNSCRNVCVWVVLYTNNSRNTWNRYNAQINYSVDCFVDCSVDFLCHNFYGVILFNRSPCNFPKNEAYTHTHGHAHSLFDIDKKKSAVANTIWTQSNGWCEKESTLKCDSRCRLFKTWTDKLFDGFVCGGHLTFGGNM